jgi:serine protease Do
MIETRIQRVLAAAVLACAAIPRLAAAPGAPADLPALWAERARCVVAVEYTVETESERRSMIDYGTVVDANGTIVLPAGSIEANIPPAQLKDFRVYLPGDSTAWKASYLGQDVFTGWHFVRAEEKLRSRVVPVTAFAARGPSPVPQIGEELWGIGFRTKEEDFLPYLLESRLSIIQSLPDRTGTALQEVSGPGLPVFNRDGVLVGLALQSGEQQFQEYSQMNRGGETVLLVDVEESSIFELADEVLPYFNRIPGDVDGRPLAWLGADGLEPMDRDVANFLNLGAQSGAVVSEVLEDSPAAKAGMQGHDIILAIDGKALPRFRPDRVVVDYLEKQISRRRPGDLMRLTVLRGAAQVEITARLEDAPKLIREARRQYFDGLGFTVREFVYQDAVQRRLKPGEGSGVIVHYVKSSSPAAVAGLQPDDWIREIDGVPVLTYDAALDRLKAASRDPLRTECVLLVSHGGDTAVLRLKLNPEPAAVPR